MCWPLAIICRRDESRKPADEFETLANVMRDKAQREEARKELEKLAQQLRDAGSRIAGQQSGSMQQMQGNQQAQQVNQSMQQMQSQQQAGAQQAMQAPGLSQGQAQQTMAQQSAQPGTGQAQQMAVAPNQAGEKKSNQQGKPTLFAPIPGAKPSDQPSTLITGGPPPKDPSSAAALSMPGSGPKAGAGSAKMEETKTQQQKAGQSATVTAKSGAEGASTTRSIEGGVRQEAANRTSEQMAVETIHEQEAALDDAALPPARREQVRRYFQELRKRFEPENK